MKARQPVRPSSGHGANAGHDRRRDQPMNANLCGCWTAIQHQRGRDLRDDPAHSWPGHQKHATPWTGHDGESWVTIHAWCRLCCPDSATARPGAAEGSRSGQGSGDRGVDDDHRFGPEVASPVLPLIVLLGEDHADQADQAGPGGEDAGHRGAPLDLLVEPLERRMRDRSKPPIGMPAMAPCHLLSSGLRTVTANG